MEAATMVVSVVEMTTSAGLFFFFYSVAMATELVIASHAVNLKKKI